MHTFEKMGDRMVDQDLINLQVLKYHNVINTAGGGSRIRTHEGLAPLTVFKTAAFNHSAIPPRS
jgi:hypothetical protein